MLSLLLPTSLLSPFAVHYVKAMGKLELYKFSESAAGRFLSVALVTQKIFLGQSLKLNLLLQDTSL